MKLLACLLALCLASSVRAQDAASAARQAGSTPPAKPLAPEGAAATQPSGAARIEQQRPSYPLTTCVVSGEALGSMGAPYETLAEGRLVRLCCKSCVRAVEKEPAAFAGRVERAVIERQRPLYPLASCPIAGEPLGPDAEDVVVGTRLVRTCCAKCAAAVAADPAPALAKVDRALIEAQRPRYPLTTCVVSGEPLTEAHESLYGLRLVRTCCPRCAQALRREPEKYLALLDAAEAQRRASEARGSEPTDGARRRDE